MICRASVFCVILKFTIASAVASNEAEKSVETLHFEHEVQVAELSKPLDELDQLYQNQLSRLRDAFRSQGDANRVQILEAEAKEFREKGLREVNQFPELVRIQTVYIEQRKIREQARDKALVSILEVYVQRLEHLKKSLQNSTNVFEEKAAHEEWEKARESMRILQVSLSAASEEEKPKSGKLVGFGRSLASTVKNNDRFVSVKLWERGNGWLALTTEGSLISHAERRVSRSRDRVKDFDCSRAGGILLLLDDGSVETSLCEFQPSDEIRAQLTDVIDVALGGGEYEDILENEIALAVRKDGSLIWWGPATDQSGFKSPIRSAATNISVVESTGQFFALLRNDGRIVIWNPVGGVNSRLAVPDELNQSAYREVAIGARHVVGLKKDGSVVAWGENNRGECDVPVDLPPCDRVRILFHGISLARTLDGRWVYWGFNDANVASYIANAGHVIDVAGKINVQFSVPFAVAIQAEPTNLPDF